MSVDHSTTVILLFRGCIGGLCFILFCDVENCVILYFLVWQPSYFELVALLIVFICVLRPAALTKTYSCLQ